MHSILTPATKASTRFIFYEQRKAKLIWVAAYISRWFTCPKTRPSLIQLYIGPGVGHHQSLTRDWDVEVVGLTPDPVPVKWLLSGWMTVCGQVNHIRSTQPFIPSGQVNLVPACLAELRWGMFTLCQVVGNTVSFHMAGDAP